MAQVLIENLSKTFLDKEGNSSSAVDHVNLAIQEGEFMVLVGPSGCGKSTTLRMIAGLEEPSLGTISIGGQIVNALSPKDRDIAMVFQNYALYPHMSVRENMSFGLRLKNLPKQEIDARVKEAASMLGLDQLLERKPKALSGGQRQRVAVGRAIVRKPKVFLFDEPLSNLDAKMRASTRSELSRLHARLGATMIYVTHDQTEAMTMGDRICVMRSGKVQQLADPLTLYSKPANLFVAGFIGSPAMNFFPGTITLEDGITYFGGDFGGNSATKIPLHSVHGAKANAAIGKRIILGLRPEDIFDSANCPPGLFKVPFEISIELAEPTGAETFLHLNGGKVPTIARVRASKTYTAGSGFCPALDMSKAHLFYAESEKALE